MSHRHRLRSAWNRVGSGEIHRAPRQWQPWLLDTGSLTQKIEKAIGYKLQVQVLRDCPQSSSGSNHSILRLGTKPLGAVLFAKTRMHSKAKPPRDIARLDRSSSLWKKCSKQYPGLSTPLWARRTLYRLRGHPILVNEIFLPALLEFLKPQR